MAITNMFLMLSTTMLVGIFVVLAEILWKVSEFFENKQITRGTTDVDGSIQE